MVHYMSRDHALDATRTFAIWFMIVCHVARLIYKEGYQLTDSEDIFARMRPPFKEADLDGTNSLNIEEFSTLFGNTSESVISTLFATYDKNQDLLLSFKELTSGATRVPLRPLYMDFSLDIEPLCQALFMTMVGVSMIYSLKLTRQPELWNGKQLRRAAELYAIGFVFFVVQYGMQWPWMFIGHGILISISSAIVLSLPLVRNIRFAYLTFIGLWTTLLVLNILDIRIGFINAGNGPFMPHVILSVFGVIAGGILLKDNRRHQKWFIAVMTAFLLISLSQLDFLQYFNYPEDTSDPYGRRDYKATYKVFGSNGIEQIWGIIQGEQLKSSVKTYYNYTATSIPLLMSLCTGVYLFFRALGPLTKKLSPVWAIGRHSLGVYMLHLILISLCTVVFGSLRPFENALEINSALAVIVSICYGYALYKERYANTTGFEGKHINSAE